MATGVCESVAETEVVARNLLLFVSALIPKALASLLTSAVIELSKPENVSIADTMLGIPLPHHSWCVVHVLFSHCLMHHS